MGKIILEFDSVDEAVEAQTALDGHKWKAAMWDLDQKLRSTTKFGISSIYRESEAPEVEVDIAEKYREILRDVLQGYGINLND